LIGNFWLGIEPLGYGALSATTQLSRDEILLPLSQYRTHDGRCDGCRIMLAAAMISRTYATLCARPACSMLLRRFVLRSPPGADYFE
jgi:hypothetical protein